MLGVMYSSLGLYIKFSFLQVPKPAPEESEGSDEVEEPSPPRRKPKPAAPPRKEAKTGHSAFADKLKKVVDHFFSFVTARVGEPLVLSSFVSIKNSLFSHHFFPPAQCPFLSNC